MDAERNRTRFGRVLRCLNAEAVGDCRFSTLGSAAWWSLLPSATLVGCSSTLGSAAWWSLLTSATLVGCLSWGWLIVAMSSTRFSCCAISRRALRIGSPACRLGVVVDGGFVRMVTMSVAAWRRWSVMVTFGKGTSCGKKVTVSHILVVGVRGK